MNYDAIRYATLEVYQECKLHSFPIDVFDMLENYGLSTHPYSSLSEELRAYCMNYSSDALFYKDKICYNDLQPKGRILFSLMHELGHVILKHCESRTPKMEQEANIFASNILAPRMAIHYASCKNSSDVTKLFGITNEAAGYAYDDYRRWYRRTLQHNMSSYDKAIYQHFYNKEANKFVYSIKQCIYCDERIYNSYEFICEECIKKNYKSTPASPCDTELLIAENQWLYHGL